MGRRRRRTNQRRGIGKGSDADKPPADETHVEDANKQNMSSASAAKDCSSPVVFPPEFASQQEITSSAAVGQWSDSDTDPDCDTGFLMATPFQVPSVSFSDAESVFEPSPAFPAIREESEFMPGCSLDELVRNVGAAPAETHHSPLVSFDELHMRHQPGGDLVEADLGSASTLGGIHAFPTGGPSDSPERSVASHIADQAEISLSSLGSVPRNASEDIPGPSSARVIDSTANPATTEGAGTNLSAAIGAISTPELPDVPRDVTTSDPSLHDSESAASFINLPLSVSESLQESAVPSTIGTLAETLGERLAELAADTAAQAQAEETQKSTVPTESAKESESAAHTPRNSEDQDEGIVLSRSLERRSVGLYTDEAASLAWSSVESVEIVDETSEAGDETPALRIETQPEADDGACVSRRVSTTDFLAHYGSAYASQASSAQPGTDGASAVQRIYGTYMESGWRRPSEAHLDEISETSFCMSPMDPLPSAQSYQSHLPGENPLPTARVSSESTLHESSSEDVSVSSGKKMAACSQVAFDLYPTADAKAESGVLKDQPASLYLSVGGMAAPRLSVDSSGSSFTLGGTPKLRTIKLAVLRPWRGLKERWRRRGTSQSLIRELDTATLRELSVSTPSLAVELPDTTFDDELMDSLAVGGAPSGSFAELMRACPSVEEARVLKPAVDDPLCDALEAFASLSRADLSVH